MNPTLDKMAHPFPFLSALPDASPKRPWLEPVHKLVGCSVYEVERELILETLRHYKGSRTVSANILKISIRCIRNKIHEYEQSGIAVSAPVPSNKSKANRASTNGITQQRLSLVAK